MILLRHPRLIIPVLLLVLLAVAPGTASAQTQSDVDRAKAAQEQAFAALAAADAELEAGLEELEKIEGELPFLGVLLKREQDVESIRTPKGSRRTAGR